MEVMFQSLVEDFTDYALEVGLQVNSIISQLIDVEYFGDCRSIKIHSSLIYME